MRTCEWCGSEFQPTDEVQAYCRKTHRTKGQARRKRDRDRQARQLSKMVISCPHPYKKPYSSEEQASLNPSFKDPTMNLYRCRCGALHFGHFAPKKELEEATA